MRKKVTRSEFRRIATDEVLTRFGPLGFTEYDACAFGRERDAFIEGFGLSPDLSVMQFYVSVGFLIPALWDRERFILGGHSPGFEISHRLGHFRNNLTGLQTPYHFYTASELRACFNKVYTDFEEQALPWLEKFPTLEDVIAEYYRYRIGPPPGGEKRQPDPFGWAIYGWMLEELGRTEESHEWLTRSYEQLRRTTYMKDGITVAEGTKGSQAVPPSPEQQRLNQLLRQSLQMPKA